MLHDEIIAIDESYFERFRRPDNAEEEKQIKGSKFAMSASIDIVRNADRDIAVFYFNHDDVIGLIETADNFWTEGLLDLPYETCIYMFENFVEHKDGSLTTGGTIISKNSEYINHILELRNIKPPSPAKCVFTEFQFSKDRIGGMCPYVGFIMEDGTNLQITPLNSARGNNCAGAIVSASLFLNTKHASTEKKQISDKLNKRRLKRGRAPLSDYKIIRLTDYNDKPTGAKGSHASPVPHWRRGHIRTLGDKKVAIPPCRVNWTGQDVKKGVYLT